MKVIILEDEIPAYNKLSKYLLSVYPKAEILMWYRSVEEALKNKERFEQCDLILSDIELLDGVSFELFSKVNVNCPIIFCTAYSHYLQQAFDANGIAYLLKPFTEEALKKAINKYLNLFKNKENSNRPEINEQLINTINNLVLKKRGNYKQRFSIKKREGITLKKIEDISYFKACGDFCILYDNLSKQHSINYKISEVEKQLDPSSFFRINRSEIINISYIEKVKTFSKNKVQVFLINGVVLVTSGSKTPGFRCWLEGDVS